jgi:hypothetical protein
MTISRRKGEQRSEVRRRVPTCRIAWTRPDATHAFTGWISDVADSSVSFVTPTRDIPKPGEAIELTFDAGMQNERYRAVQVARTAPYDRFFSVVACQNVTGLG